VIGLDRTTDLESNLFYASVEQERITGHQIDYRMLGSRAIAVVTHGPDLAELIQQSNQLIERSFTGPFFFRRDIGANHLSSHKDPTTTNTTDPAPIIPTKSTITYQDSGVNIDEGNLVVNRIRDYVKSTHNQHVVKSQYGNFGGSYQLSPDQPTLVTSMDGVGTKVQTVLNLLPREEAFTSLGHDLLSSNLNDILCLGRRVKPLFFLDYFGCQQLSHRDVQAFVGGLSEACRSSECVLIGGETAELPDFSRAWENYHRNQIGMEELTPKPTSYNYELVGTVVGSLLESDRFDPSKLQPGHLVLALRSSGLHTNGYSLINRLITSGRLDPTSYRLALCAAHRNYYWDLKRIESGGLIDQVLGLCHITGGGLVDNPPRILPPGLAIEWRRDSWQMPPLFQAIQKAANLNEQEMHRTFNCGLGLLLVVPDQETYQSMTELFEPGDLLHVGGLISK
jgi:phosphoribosylformylglycinamidine cyclo-ligase